MVQQQAFERAKQIRLDFSGDGLVFAFRDPRGEQWEGGLDEWIGNDRFDGYDVFERAEDGRRYVPVGAFGGGADWVLIRDDGAVCYLNDYDQQVSEVAKSVDEFVALLRSPS